MLTRKMECSSSDAHMKAAGTRSALRQPRCTAADEHGAARRPGKLASAGACSGRRAGNEQACASCAVAAAEQGTSTACRTLLSTPDGSESRHGGAPARLGPPPAA